MLSPLAYASYLSVTTPKGLNIGVTPAPPLNLHPIYYHLVQRKRTCHIQGFPRPRYRREEGFVQFDNPTAAGLRRNTVDN